MRAILSDAFILRSPLAKRYFVVGMAGLAAVAAAMAAGFTVRHALPRSAAFAFSVSTGSALLACILYQWMLFVARILGDGAAARRHWAAHRYVGTASIVLFAVHAGTVGHAAVGAMAVVFLLIAATGLWNPEILLLRRPWLRQAWQFCHVGLSGLLMPLIALHAWAALAFK